jgi:hypothetical protein
MGAEGWSLHKIADRQNTKRVPRLSGEGCWQKGPIRLATCHEGCPWPPAHMVDEDFWLEA